MVDREHKALLQLVNLLLCVGEQENPGVALEEAYAALERFVNKHFNDEEGLLEAVDSPYLDSQKAQHDMLRRELSTLWSPNSPLPPAQVVKELTVWAEKRLLHHLYTFDAETFSAPPFD